MVRYENQCMDCATGSYPCAGSSCEYRHVPVYYCDKCGEEVDRMWEYEGEQWCRDCIMVDVLDNRLKEI